MNIVRAVARVDPRRGSLVLTDMSGERHQTCDFDYGRIGWGSPVEADAGVNLPC